MIRALLVSFISIFIFTGCISLTKELPAYKTYALEYPKDNIKSKYFDKTIEVFEPKALNSINTRAISYSKEGFINDKYALSRWSDRPTKMIQQNIASYLTRKNAYKYITTSNIKVDSDYRVVSELTDFKHTFTKNYSYADFSIRVYFINNKTQKVFFKSFTYNKKADINNAQGLVNSINSLSNSFLIDLNNFIQSSLKADNKRVL